MARDDVGRLVHYDNSGRAEARAQLHETYQNPSGPYR